MGNMHTTEVKSLDINEVSSIVVDDSKINFGQKYLVVGEVIFEAAEMDSEVAFSDGQGSTSIKRKFKKTNYRLYKGGIPIKVME
jgi:gamma-glutamylcysteine synthetase